LLAGQDLCENVDEVSKAMPLTLQLSNPVKGFDDESSYSLTFYSQTGCGCGRAP
jgi:hypothetical protein